MRGLEVGDAGGAGVVSARSRVSGWYREVRERTALASRRISSRLAPFCNGQEGWVGHRRLHLDVERAQTECNEPSLQADPRRTFLFTMPFGREVQTCFPFLSSKRIAASSPISI